MSNRRRSQLSFELLENRWTPAGTVTGTFANGTWTLVGDAEANSIRIDPPVLVGSFTVSGINTTVAGDTSAYGVKNIVVKLRGGTDSVEINNTGVEGILRGNLTINGGSAATEVYIKDFYVGKNLTIRNGGNTTGVDDFKLVDSIVRGNLIINNGNGDTHTALYRSSAGSSYIRRNLNIINGTGEDVIEFNDYNFGGHVTVTNGRPSATNEAGYLSTYNIHNTMARSVFGGNLRVDYQGGNTNDYDYIRDCEIRGNVTFIHGAGKTETNFGSEGVALPMVIHGNVTIKDQGRSTVNFSFSPVNYGVIIGRNLTVISGGQADTFLACGLRVQGATRIVTGSEADAVYIDDSVFGGPRAQGSPFGFQLLTGAGNDTVQIETTSAFDFGTQFLRAVQLGLGSGTDTLTMGAANDPTRAVEFFRRATLAGGADADAFNRLNVTSPFGAVIDAFFETITI